jgi:hypothetical protein
MARLKNIEAFCSSCNTVQKMELGGDVSGEEGGTKKWAKCKKCKHTMVIDVTESMLLSKISLEGIENEDSTVYSPLKTYKVGEPIYHKDWDDFGRVVSKEILSTGQKSIAVEFQKSGLKKLIESLNN